MRKSAQRIIAAVLFLCMTLPMLSPVIPLADTPVQNTPVVYDFTSVAEINGLSAGNATITATKNQMTAGTLNWSYIGKDNLASIIVGGTSADGQTVRTWDGFRFSVKPNGGWIAMKIKSPGEGNFDIKVNYQTCKDYGNTDVYILPGTTALGDINTALATATSYGSFNCYSTSYTYVDCNVALSTPASFEADKEYIVVFKTPNATTSNVFSCVTGLEMSVAQNAPAQPDSTEYDFTAATEVNGISVGSAVITATKNLMDAGTLNWAYIGKDNLASIYTGGESADGQYSRAWDGFRFSSKPNGGWIAMKMKSPGEGDFNIKVNYQTYKNYGVTDVYFLPGTTALADINAALATATSYGSFNCNSTTSAYADASVTLANTASFEADKEYVVVFKTPNDTTSNVFSCVTGLVLTDASYVPPETTDPTDDTTSSTEDTTSSGGPEITPPVQLDKATYNFAGVAEINGTSVGSNTISTTKNQMEAGTLNWAYVAKDNCGSIMVGGTSADGQTVRSWKGFRFSAMPVGGWIAMKIASPGSGNYKLTVDYMTYKDYGVVQTYVLPGDTEDVNAALESATSAGSFDCYSTTAQYANGKATLSRAQTMVAGEEYLVVFYIRNSGASNIFACVKALTLNIYTGTDLGGGDQEETKPVDPGQRNKVNYNFDLGHNKKVNVKGESFAGKNPTFSVVSSAIGDYYADYVMDWKFHSFADNINGYPMFGGKTAEKDYLWDGIRIYGKDKESGEQTTGYYAAFTLRSPGTGKYYLTVNYQMHRYGASQGSVYVLPADTKDIAKAIASGKALATISYDNRGADSNAQAESDTKIVATPISCKLGKEYIVVFTADKPGKAGYSYMYLKGVKLTHKKVMPAIPEEEGPVQLDKATYDFDLGNTKLKANGVTFAGQGLMGASVYGALDGYYMKDKVNWSLGPKPVGYSVSALFGGKAADREYEWNGLRVYAKDGDKMMRDYYIALLIKSPGTGKYKLTVDYGVHRFGAKNTNVYILDADTQDIAAALKKTKALGTLKFDNGSSTSAGMPDPGRSTYASAVSMKAGEEYYVVFRTTEIGRVAAYMYLDSITLTKQGVKTPADIIPERVPEPEPIPAGSTVYDFDLVNSVTGIYKGKQPILSKVDDLNSRYKSGQLNWNYFSHDTNDENAMAFNSPGGMTIYSYKEKWIAVKIKSPGKGLYTMALNHGISGNGAEGAVYILPGDTEDVYAAMDHANRVGKVNYYNTTGKSAITGDQRTVLGTWEFGDEKECIVVFEAFKSTPYDINRAYMFISQLIATPGDYTGNVVQEKKINSIVVEPGAVKICDVTLYGTMAVVNGSNYLYIPLEGKKMLIYNLDDGVLVGETETPFTVPRGITTDENGIIWIVGDKPYMYRYDPITNVGYQYDTYKTIDPESYTSFDLAQDGKGNLYFGSHPGGFLMKFNMNTGEYTKVCNPGDDASYVCGIEYQDGFIYAGVSGDKNSDGVSTEEAIKVNAETGEVVARLNLTDLCPDSHVMFRGAGLCKDVFFLGGEGTLKETIAIDVNTWERIDIGINTGIAMHTSEEVDGKVYFVANGGRGLQCFDGKTRKATSVAGFENVTVGLRISGTSFVTLDDPVYPGPSIITYDSNAIPRAFNIQSGKIKTWEVVDVDKYGTPTEARLVVDSGDGKFYTGAYNTTKCVAYDIAQGKVVGTFETQGQTDSMLMYEGNLYAGNYSSGALVRVNMNDPKRNVVMLSLKTEYHQTRIHTITAGDGKVFCGSVPDRYEYGGCIAWVDVNTLERYVERNVVQDQALISLVYHDGYLYGATTTRGGTGAAERPDLSAKLFVYDVANKKKVAEVDLRNRIPGLPSRLDFIAGIAADPNIDENGKLWGVVSETLFSFSFNEETGKVSVKEELSYDKSTIVSSNGRESLPRPFVFDDEGYMYVAFNNNGGLRKINTKNPSDNKRILSVAPMHYNIDDDNNLYYLEQSSMKLYPMDVTQEDWAISGKVDDLIRALNTKVTLEDEEAILAAREAYNALSWRHRALVQLTEKLEYAECDLLECKIDALNEEITLEDKDVVFGLKEQYDALEERLQRYIKNYDKLDAAVLKIQGILDKIAADKVQKMINGIKDLGEITLEDEEAIRAIRKAYDALTVTQRSMVNATLLLDAEAVIYKLRQEIVQKLIKMIASIGEVTLEDEPVIEEAMEIFEWLTLDERNQVDFITLNAANKTLIKLQKAAAAEVDAMILTFGENATIFSAGAILKARKAYDALTPGSKVYVNNLAMLEQAEKVLTVSIIVTAIVVVVAAGGTTGVLLVRKKKSKAKATTAEPKETE